MIDQQIQMTGANYCIQNHLGRAWLEIFEARKYFGGTHPAYEALTTLCTQINNTHGFIVKSCLQDLQNQ